MVIFKKFSIKHKLTAIAILPSTLALLMAILIFFIFDESTLKRAMVQEVTMLSQVIGANNRAALMFNDQKSASDNLAVLSANTHVISGCMYTSSGEVFATYTRDSPRSSMANPPLREVGYYFDDATLSIYQKITANSTNIGTVHLKYDLEALYARRNGYLAIAAAILLIVSGLVFVLSSWLKKAISDPILSLIETAKAITHEKDYSTRVSGEVQGEFGVLIDGFNEMLAQIQERDARLARNSEELERQVISRTDELKSSNDNLRIQIEENAKIEEELFRARQIESLGILAGGIAHDFNNLLTAILGNISLSKMYVPEGEKVHRKLCDAEKASLRARELTQQLLTFSRGGAPVKKIASIANVVRDSACFTLSGSRATCRFNIPDDLHPVEVDEGQFSQVINNLVINADQAMPEGGEIEITCANVSLGPELTVPLAAGPYVLITIRDQGEGIPEDILPRIFDPYFSTKESGKGLGLATVYSIVKNHDGHISATSCRGVGTLFSIYLPATVSGVVEQRSEEVVPNAGKGKILVMDDEEIIREVAGEMLMLIGYEVEFARDGKEALELYRLAGEARQPFDAVIMDLTISGGMGGKDAVKLLREMDGNVRAIVSSGYSTDPIMADYRAFGFSGVITKPYKVSELKKILNEVVG